MKVSIIVPVYNVETYIHECLSSVTAQTFTNDVECILIDDCGNDNSMKIVKDFISTYNGDIHFRLLHHHNNRGLSAARNTGIKASTGEYIFFLDSDDRLTENCLELLYSKVISYGKIDLVQGTTRIFDLTDKGKLYNQKEFVDNQAQIKRYLLTNDGDIISAQNRLIRRTLFDLDNMMFREGIIHEDTYWSFFLAKNVKTMVFCTVPTYLYTINPNSITNSVNIRKKYNSFLIITRELSNNIDDFLPGVQKEYLLNNLFIALRSGYFSNEDERKTLINNFANINSWYEKMFICALCQGKNEKLQSVLLHTLIRIYKLSD